MKITVFTLFPEMVVSFCSMSLLGKGLKRDIWSLKVINIRDYSYDKHGRVDDSPFGGGKGMIIRADVLGRALEDSALDNKTKIYYMSPRGKLLDQQMLSEMAKLDEIALVCGRYEGIDQRVIDEYGIEEISIGDFVLMGGELPALALIEGVVRYRNDLIEAESIEEDSFGAARANRYRNLLEYPLYTGPQSWKGRKVPAVLLSGNHREVEKWKFEQAKAITRERRPDLYKKHLEEFPK
ncbi:MAG: tRNA (guanosine(37)-N1)-methyltransferase TrmD [Rickettsiales bacterium]|nr:tRNA (guanosine(37)-N1)-methyltransferase TrmD [Rickettsiales bacterium]